jgi:hypothetical protein
VVVWWRGGVHRHGPAQGQALVQSVTSGQAQDRVPGRLGGWLAVGENIQRISKID